MWNSEWKCCNTRLSFLDINIKQMRNESGLNLPWKMTSPKEHGVGIRNIIDVIERYHGVYMIQNNENEFYFSILFDDIMSFSA